MTGMSTFLAFVRIEILTIKYEFSIMRYSYTTVHCAVLYSTRTPFILLHLKLKDSLVSFFHLPTYIFSTNNTPASARYCKEVQFLV